MKGLLQYSPEVYGVVRDARTNAPDHLVNTNVVNVVSRDDVESDVFVLDQISLVLHITVIRLIRAQSKRTRSCS